MVVRRPQAHLAWLERAGLKCSSGSAYQTLDPGRGFSHQEDRKTF